MKKFFLIWTVCLLSGMVAVAQDYEDEPQMRTVFSGPEVSSLGGYGALDVGYTSIDGLDALLLGARGAVVDNHSLALGLGGKAFISQTVYDSYLQNDYEYIGGYGGFIFEPIIKWDQPVHLSIPVLIGAGGIGYLRHWGDYENDFEDEYSDEDSYAFFVLEPGVEVEFNLVSWMRVAVYGSYRLTSNVKLDYKNAVTDVNAPSSIASPDLLRGFNAGLIFKFGKF